MSNKRDLHTLFIKHDTDFGTLSKKALSEVILKIILFQDGGTRLAQIQTELAGVISGNVSEKVVLEALKVLEKDGKIVQKRAKYTIDPRIKPKLEKAVKFNTELIDRIYLKYLTGFETSNVVLQAWFKDTLILFFENFSLEWFSHVRKNGKLAQKKIDNNVVSAIDELLLQYDGKILKKEHDWLRSKFIQFYESDESDENIMFWNFGMSMFSSRLITARNYADKISIETYRNGTFLLDTNILMILDLEAHEFGKSFNSLDKIFRSLNIQTKYLHITAEEYKRAILGRKADTMNVFDSYDDEVLSTTKCPFVQTAIERGCSDSTDIERMFERLLDVPKSIYEFTSIEKIDYDELDQEVNKGTTDDDLKNKINDIHKKRTRRDKRDNPKRHDAGLVQGVNFLRKTEKVWILTTDGTIKLYAIENQMRDQTEIAIGLDALIGMFAVNNGGVDVDSSDFAPLFKSLIKHSLIPEENVFDVRDLSFILSTNLRINDLESIKVIEIANEVRKMRIAGKDDEEISLFLRREIEGQKFTLTSEVAIAKDSEAIAKVGKAKAENESKLAFDEIRRNRIQVLREEYDSRLFKNRLLLFFVPLVVLAITIAAFEFVQSEDKLINLLISIGVEIIISLLAVLPINKRIKRKNSEYINGIETKVDLEINDIKRKAKEL